MSNVSKPPKTNKIQPKDDSVQHLKGRQPFAVDCESDYEEQNDSNEAGHEEKVRQAIMIRLPTDFFERMHATGEKTLGGEMPEHENKPANGNPPWC